MFAFLRDEPASAVARGPVTNPVVVAMGLEIKDTTELLSFAWRHKGTLRE
jgi:hypothetical protein